MHDSGRSLLHPAESVTRRRGSEKADRADAEPHIQRAIMMPSLPRRALLLAYGSAATSARAPLAAGVHRSARAGVTSMLPIPGLRRQSVTRRPRIRRHLVRAWRRAAERGVAAPPTPLALAVFQVPL